jgi:leucyl aminopeptidase
MKTLFDQIKVSITANHPKSAAVDVWVIPVFKDEKLSPELKKIDNELHGTISEWIDQDFIQNDKEKNTWFTIKNSSFKTSNFLFMSMGKKKDFTRNSARDVFGTASKLCNNRGFHRVGIFEFGLKEIPFEVALEGFLLGSYRFTHYKSEKSAQGHIRHVEVACATAALARSLSKAYERIACIVRATFLARDLVNEPANVVTPESFAQIAQKIATEKKIAINVLKIPELKKEDMNLMLAVAQGSANHPCLIHLEYKPKKKAKHTIALVGKGVTFDTGGYSLKPPASMLGMKMDMAGAASVLATVWAAAMLELPVHVHGFMGMVENMVSDKSIRPSDVVRGRSGKSVEIDNTDAEGRLVLADILNYAEEFNPDYMIDVATLTGACVIALGDEIAALFSSDDKLQSMIQKSSEEVGDKMWPMPMEKSYFSQYKSEIADFKNVGGREAGSITAALFLKEFVTKTPWAHIDIAGTSEAQKDFPICPKGATGSPVRTFVNLLENL